MSEDKWFWLMDYCKAKGWPPSERWAWEKAALAFEAANTNGDKE